MNCLGPEVGRWEFKITIEVKGLAIQQETIAQVAVDVTDVKNRNVAWEDSFHAPHIFYSNIIS